MAASNKFEFSHIAFSDYVGFNHINLPAPTLTQFIQKIKDYRERKSGFVIPILCWISGTNWGPSEYKDGKSHYITGFFSVTNSNYSEEYKSYGILVGFGYDNDDLGDMFVGNIKFGKKEDMTDCTISWKKIH